MLIEDPWLLRWLRTLRRLTAHGEDGLICPMSPAALNRRLAALVERFAPSCRGFTAGGLRAGGAAHFVRAGRSVEWLRHRGRWRALQSSDHYVQECGAVLAEPNLAPSERADVDFAAQLLPEVLDEAETLLSGGPSAVAPEDNTPCTLLRQAPRKGRGPLGPRP